MTIHEIITDERGGQQRNKVGPFIPSRRPISAARKHVAIIQKERDIRRKQNVLYQKNAHDAACNVKVLHCSIASLLY